MEKEELAGWGAHLCLGVGNVLKDLFLEIECF